MSEPATPQHASAFADLAEAPRVDPALDPATAEGPRRESRARSALLRRLADVVCLPSSRINAFERSMTADLLVEMLGEANRSERERAARRLVGLVEVPSSLARLLLRDEPPVARALLEECASLHDAELIDCARHGLVEHRRMIAQRREVSEVVSEALVAAREPAVIEALMRNETARLSNDAIEAIVGASREDHRFVGMLLRRRELRPRHAYVMFWWADEACRRTILQRFAVSREVLQEASSDVFAMLADEGWQDPMARKALQFIERRQRNRAAIAKSPFDSLDQAIAASESGMTTELAEEISYLAGLKPITGTKILADAGGEPLAILCKATGLPRINLTLLWRALRRPETDEGGAPSVDLERVIRTYDMIAVDRAQTVLRYWNWSLSSAMTSALVDVVVEGESASLGEYSVSERAALLALSSDPGR